MEEVTKESQAALRKEVYDFLSALGYPLKPKEQDGLSKILKSVLETRVREVEVQREVRPPEEHHLTCPKCLGIEIKKGYMGRMYVKLLKKNQPSDPMKEEV